MTKTTVRELQAALNTLDWLTNSEKFQTLAVNAFMPLEKFLNHLQEHPEGICPFFNYDLFEQCEVALPLKQDKMSAEASRQYTANYKREIHGEYTLSLDSEDEMGSLDGQYENYLDEEEVLADIEQLTTLGFQIEKPSF